MGHKEHSKILQAIGPSWGVVKKRNRSNSWRELIEKFPKHMEANKHQDPSSAMNHYQI